MVETEGGMSEIANSIGATVWRFDENYRVYKNKHGGPDYRSHWRECRITAETTRSWIAGPYGKIPKRGDHDGWALSVKEVDDDVWAKDTRCKIVRLVERCDVHTLRNIANIIGYKPPAAESSG